MARIGSPVEDLRVTLIDQDGNVLYDNGRHAARPVSGLGLEVGELSLLSVVRTWQPDVGIVADSPMRWPR